MQEIKLNAVRSRIEHLNIREAQEKYRKNYLESINRLHMLSKEWLKKRYKRYNITFGKEKMKSINKLKYYK